MRKKYQDILLNSAILVSQIPGVSTSGATATASVYVSAYNDYYEVCRLLGYIASNIQLIEDLENALKKNKQEYEECDMDEFKEQIDWYSEKIDGAYKELEEFISERKGQGWR